MTVTAPELLTRLRQLRSDAIDQANAVARRTAGRSLTTGDALALQERLDDVRRLDGDIERLSRPPVVQVRSEPLTYERDGEHSIFKDLISQDPAAGARLDRHAREMDVELRRRRVAAERRFDGAVADGLIEPERRTNPNTTAGQGGYFAPPLWLLAEFGSVGRAGRVLADLVATLPLPAGGGVSTINVPRMTVGGAVAVQADGAAVLNADLTDAVASSRVQEITGKVDASIQLSDQSGSPAAFDAAVFADLSQDYNAKLEAQLIGGNGTAPQLLGLLAVAGITATTYTDASPTPGEMIVAAGQCASLTATARGLVPTAMLVHGRRWYWMASQTDTAGRPILPLGDADGAVGGDGGPPPVGTVLGIPTYADQAIPLTLGGGTEDRLIVTRPGDHLLLESEPVVMVLREVLSGTLQVRLVLRRTAAFIPHRWPSATGVVSGSGMAAPAGY